MAAVVVTVGVLWFVCETVIVGVVPKYPPGKFAVKKAVPRATADAACSDRDSHQFKFWAVASDAASQAAVSRPRTTYISSASIAGHTAGIVISSVSADRITAVPRSRFSRLLVIRLAVVPGPLLPSQKMLR